MENIQTKNLETARLLIRFYGIFGGLAELSIIATIVNLVPLLIYNSDNDRDYLIASLISVIIFLIYVLTSQAINGRTYVQKIQKIYIINQNGETIQFKDSIKRMLSKLIIILLWLVPWFILSFFLSNIINNDELLPIIKFSLFFGFLSAPILMIPMISGKSQTLYDYLSNTRVVVNYQEIKKEERQNINRLIEDPMLIDKENPNVSIQARLIAILIFYILKIF